MKIIKKYSFYILTLTIFLIAFLVNNYRSKNEANSFQCKFQEITSDSVKDIGGDFDEKTIKEVNDKIPYCKDICLDELETAKKYPNEWYISKESRKLCEQAGISLPN
jgi:hypothetical protein